MRFGGKIPPHIACPNTSGGAQEVLIRAHNSPRRHKEQARRVHQKYD